VQRPRRSPSVRPLAATAVRHTSFTRCQDLCPWIRLDLLDLLFLSGSVRSDLKGLLDQFWTCWNRVSYAGVPPRDPWMAALPRALGGCGTLAGSAAHRSRSTHYHIPRQQPAVSSGFVKPRHRSFLTDDAVCARRGGGGGGATPRWQGVRWLRGRFAAGGCGSCVARGCGERLWRAAATDCAMT